MIDEFDEQDVVLKQFLGERYHDEDESVKAESKKVCVNITGKAKYAEKPSGERQPPKVTPKQMDKLRECAKTAAVYGGLNTLLFYWQLNGLMDASIAVPSMCVVCCLMGLGIGKVVGGK